MSTTKDGPSNSCVARQPHKVFATAPTLGVWPECDVNRNCQCNNNLVDQSSENLAFEKHRAQQPRAAQSSLLGWIAQKSTM
jgi:hypothetical protein